MDNLDDKYECLYQADSITTCGERIDRSDPRFNRAVKALVRRQVELGNSCVSSGRASKRSRNYTSAELAGIDYDGFIDVDGYNNYPRS